MRKGQGQYKIKPEKREKKDSEKNRKEKEQKGQNDCLELLASREVYTRLISWSLQHALSAQLGPHDLHDRMIRRRKTADSQW